MRKIRLSSELPVSFRDELERIVFFNPDQERVTKSLLESIKRHGIPSIVEEDGRLRFRLPEYGPVQSLFAFDEQGDDGSPCLASVALFTRKSRTTMVVLHLATHEDYTMRGRYGDAAVTVRLLQALRDLSARIHGVTILRSEYPRPMRLVVRPRHAKPGGKPWQKPEALEARPAGKARLRSVSGYT